MQTIEKNITREVKIISNSEYSMLTISENHLISLPGCSENKGQNGIKSKKQMKKNRA
jgi:hypothetical protein